MVSVMDTLGVNVASIIIGAMLSIITISWVDAFKSLSETVFFDIDLYGNKSEHDTTKKFISSLFITMLGGFVIICVLIVYGSGSNKNVKTSAGIYGAAIIVADTGIHESAKDNGLNDLI